MTILRRVRASAARAKFVNRPRRRVWPAFLGLVTVLISTPWIHGELAESAGGGSILHPVEATNDRFHLSLALRGEQVPVASLQAGSRRLRLRDFVEPELPPMVLVSLGATDSREDWDWAGLRRQIVHGVVGSRRILFERECLCVESERFIEPGRIPGLVQDAAIAAGVRAGLAGELALRGIPLEVQCREGCVRLRGHFTNCQAAARVVTLALRVEGVREVRTDLPDDLRREMAANR